ncbi:MAG: glycosyltransferase family 4 protein [Flavobacteriales bacterium]
MKIVYFKDRICQTGGMERILAIKANYLVDKGYDIYIVTVEDGKKEPYYKLDSRIKIINLNIEFEKVNQYHKFNFPAKRFFIKQKIKEYQKKVQKVLDEICPDIAISMFGMEYYFWNKIKFSGKSIVELHFSKKGVIENAKHPISNFLYKLQLEITFKTNRFKTNFFTYVVHLTNQDKKDWGNLKNSIVIPNPLIFEPDDNRFPDYNVKKVLSVGRYTHQKGFDLLIKVWEKVVKKYPDWTLTIVGSGDRDPFLQQKEKLKIKDENLEILLPSVDIKENYYKSSIYVGASRWEGFGLVITEAMLCGLPIVFFNTPCGPSDIITHKDDGFVVEYKNLDDLYNKLVTLIEKPELRKKMGRKAKENVKRFDLDIIMKKWMELFNELIS